ncbi:MAG: DUF1326 domain-containing protein [Acidobacteria bacterium]|nr:DUF1326 domain-containing protein [Acidobacteriota bacterium]MCY3966843.1 DUF1326 domain-containing protein [Acidobacteriota bacterium]
MRLAEMHRLAAALPAVIFILLPAAALGAGVQVSGTYVEARTADVYTGPCFANSEVGLVGKEAIMAWRIEEGGWDGVDLSGLSVLAVVRSEATLGDPYAERLGAESVLVVDAGANPTQRRALEGFARGMGGELLADVAVSLTAEVEFDVRANGAAAVHAGELAALRTRPLDHRDHLCGNETVFYPPLAPTEGAEPGVALEHSWQGEGLGTTWKSPGKRSSFVGRFSR